MQKYQYVIHKPGEEDEKGPVPHFSGRAMEDFAVNEAPTYGQHPADLVGEWEEIEEDRTRNTVPLLNPVPPRPNKQQDIAVSLWE